MRDTATKAFQAVQDLGYEKKKKRYDDSQRSR